MLSNRKYVKIDDERRHLLIKMIFKDKKSIAESSRALKIPYENAKCIKRTFLKEHRVKQHKTRFRLKRGEAPNQVLRKNIPLDKIEVKSKQQDASQSTSIDTESRATCGIKKISYPEVKKPQQITSFYEQFQAKRKPGDSCWKESTNTQQPKEYPLLKAKNEQRLKQLNLSQNQNEEFSFSNKQDQGSQQQATGQICKCPSMQSSPLNPNISQGIPMLDNRFALNQQVKQTSYYLPAQSVVTQTPMTVAMIPITYINGFLKPQVHVLPRQTPPTHLFVYRQD